MKSYEEIREGEAPAEPRDGKLLIQNGSAGASPSRGRDRRNFSQPCATPAVSSSRFITPNIRSLVSPEGLGELGKLLQNIVPPSPTLVHRSIDHSIELILARLVDKPLEIPSRIAFAPAGR
jgi:hypothetical protein